MIAGDYIDLTRKSMKRSFMHQAVEDTRPSYPSFGVILVFGSALVKGHLWPKPGVSRIVFVFICVHV